MTFDEFDKFDEILTEECRSMRSTKGKEYAGTGDRFDNFNRLATKMNVDRLTIANIYLTKHMDAIDSYIRNGLTFSNEGIRGRIVDAIVYLKLIAGMIEERAVPPAPKVECTPHKFKFGETACYIGAPLRVGVKSLVKYDKVRCWPNNLIDVISVTDLTNSQWYWNVHLSDLEKIA